MWTRISAGGDGEAEDLAGRDQGREGERHIAEFVDDAADHDLQPDHRGDGGIDGLEAALGAGAFAALADAVEKGEESEVAPAFGELGEHRMLVEQSEENGPHRHHGEGADQRPVERVAVPLAQLEDGERAVEQGGEQVAPEGDQGDHQRAHSAKDARRAEISRDRGRECSFCVIRSTRASRVILDDEHRDNDLSQR